MIITKNEENCKYLSRKLRALFNRANDEIYNRITVNVPKFTRMERRKGAEFNKISR